MPFEIKRDTLPWWYEPEGPDGGTPEACLADFQEFMDERLKLNSIGDKQRAPWENSDAVNMACGELLNEMNHHGRLFPDWSLLGEHTDVLEKHGVYPMLMISTKDVLTVAPYLTENECEEMLERMKRKVDWEWTETVSTYAAMMFTEVPPHA